MADVLYRSAARSRESGPCPLRRDRTTAEVERIHNTAAWLRARLLTLELGMASEEMTVALSAADVEPPDGEDDETHEADHDVYAACRQFEGLGK